MEAITNSWQPAFRLSTCYMCGQPDRNKLFTCLEAGPDPRNPAPLWQDYGPILCRVGRAVQPERGPAQQPLLTRQ